MNENIPFAIKELFERAVQEEVARRELSDAQKLEQRIKTAIEYQSGAYERGAAFIAVLIGAGYVGLFAIWGWVAPYLQAWQTLSIALLLGTSLIVFLIWQIHGMLTLANSSMLLAKAIQEEPGNFDAVFANYVASNRRDRARIALLLPWVMHICLYTGLGGAILLIGSCAVRLVMLFACPCFK